MHFTQPTEKSVVGLTLIFLLRSMLVAAVFVKDGEDVFESDVHTRHAQNAKRFSAGAAFP
jgi:hypothetical protein